MMNLIDISHVINKNTPVYPGDICVQLDEYKHGNCIINNLTTCMHAGTHIDMPKHMIASDKTAADYPIGNFIGEGILFDINNIDAVKESSVVIIHTGFDKYYHEPKYFTDYPAISLDLAEFFVSKKIKMLALDTPSPDYYPFPVHKLLLANDIFILENVTNLEKLHGIPKFEVIALPLKIEAEASLVRAVCRL